MILIMDARAFNDIDDAVVLDTADNLHQAKIRAMFFGNMKKFEVALVKDDEVMWELYA